MRAQLLAEIDVKLIKELKKQLIDEGTTYRDWLERQIGHYLANCHSAQAEVRK